MAWRRRSIGDGACAREERCGAWTSAEEEGKGEVGLGLGSYRLGKGGGAATGAEKPLMVMAHGGLIREGNGRKLKGEIKEGKTPGLNCTLDGSLKVKGARERRGNSRWCAAVQSRGGSRGKGWICQVGPSGSERRKGRGKRAAGARVTTPSEIILYYRLNHSIWSLSDNKEPSR
jgi:hypothetical protein